MSLKKAKEYYSLLNPSQKSFVDDKTISSTMSIEKWMGFLARAAAYDEYGDKARKKMNTMFIVYFVAAFVSIIITFMFVYWAIFILIFGALAIIKYQNKKNFARKDLHNYLRLFFFPLLDILSKKAGKDAKLSAQLDFRIPEKVQERKKYEANGRKIQQYSQNFIMAKLELLDGSKLEFVVADNFFEQSYYKKGASGKTKHKFKKKTVHGYFLKITAPKSVYSLNEVLPEGVEIAEQDESYLIKRKGKSKTAEIDHILPISEFLGGVQEIYEALKAKDSKWTTATGKKRQSEDEGEEYYDDYDDVAYVMWTGAYFDRYDYDSFDREGVEAYDYSDSDTFFDS